MDQNQNNMGGRANLSDALNKYKTVQGLAESIPVSSNFTNQEQYENIMMKETDPDLITTYEIVKLPSKGLYYQNKLSEVLVEYMTSKDEDLLTTPSLLENGTVLDVLLRRKIKTKGIVPEHLLSGDRDAIILFLRSSSYGSEYTVQVTDPRSGIPFTTNIDLTKLKYKEISKIPDNNGYFSVFIPMRKKNVIFKLLNYGEEDVIFKKSQAIQEAYSEEFSEFITMKLKASIISIEGKTDRSYIDRFIDAMPALDAYTIRKEILNVSPGVDMSYEFIAKDGYKFITNLSIGVDFFFPNI